MSIQCPIYEMLHTYNFSENSSSILIHIEIEIIFEHKLLIKVKKEVYIQKHLFWVMAKKIQYIFCTKNYVIKKYSLCG